MTEFGIWNEIRLNLLALGATVAAVSAVAMLCWALTRSPPEQREI